VIKDNPGVCKHNVCSLANCSRFEFPLRTVLAFTAKKLSRILKIESVALEYDFRNSDLFLQDSK
jgi:hypothetical protein